MADKPTNTAEKPSPQRDREESQYYSMLEVNRTLQTGLSFLAIGTGIFVGFTIFGILYATKPWITLVAPIIIICLPLTFYPMVEKWKYKPWQAKPQKYEIHNRS